MLMTAVPVPTLDHLNTSTLLRCPARSNVAKHLDTLTAQHLNTVTRLVRYHFLSSYFRRSPQAAFIFKTTCIMRTENKDSEKDLNANPDSKLNTNKPISKPDATTGSRRPDSN